MSRDIVGRQQNATNQVQVTTLVIGVAPTNILEDNPKRTYHEVYLYPGTSTVSMTLRPYDAAVDALFQGAPIQRDTTGNVNIHNTAYRSPLDHPYTGPVSARTLTGAATIFVLEHIHE